MSFVTYAKCDGCGITEPGDTYPDTWSAFAESAYAEQSHYCSVECAGDKLGGAPSVAEAMKKRLGITDKDVLILERIAGGKSNKEIGNIFGFSESTIKNRTSQLYLRLGVVDRSQAILIAGALSLINLNELAVHFLQEIRSKNKSTIQ